MRDRSAIIAALAMGAGLMYLFDPERGRSRRARLRDRLTHAARMGGDAFGATSRDVAHRTSGAAARLRGILHHEVVDDGVLVERVRAQLGRASTHPRAITVKSDRGVVTVSGLVLTAEVPRVLRAVERVRGVRDVVSALEEHETPGAMAALQGARAQRAAGGSVFDVLRDASGGTPTARLLTGTAGMTLAGYGLARRGKAGALLAAAGIGLVARAARAVVTHRVPARNTKLRV